MMLPAFDESSYSPGSGAMGDHPIAWYRSVDNGRAWYTNMGHNSETYGDAAYARHLLEGILWAGGVVFRDGFESGDLTAWPGP